MQEDAADDVGLDPFVTGIASRLVKDEMAAVTTRGTSAIKNDVLTRQSPAEALGMDAKALLDAAVRAPSANESRNNMETPSSPSQTPSLKALESAAMVQLAKMVKDGDKKPSLEALQMTARLMAKKAQRELLVREEQGRDNAG